MYIKPTNTHIHSSTYITCLLWVFLWAKLSGPSATSFLALNTFRAYLTNLTLPFTMCLQNLLSFASSCSIYKFLPRITYSVKQCLLVWQWKTLIFSEQIRPLLCRCIGTSLQINSWFAHLLKTHAVLPKEQTEAQRDSHRERVEGMKSSLPHSLALEQARAPKDHGSPPVQTLGNSST